MRDLFVYAVVRLAIFGAIWGVLALIGMPWYIAGVLAALISMLISILLLGRARGRAADRWREADERRRERRGEARDADADEEDSLLYSSPEDHSRR